MGYVTVLLDEAVRNKRSRQEELRQQLMERLLCALDRLDGKIAFKEAYIFGSVTKPFGFSEGSDIDVGFSGLDNRDFFAAMSFLSGETGVDVDIVQLEGHRLADSIRREGTRWKRKV